MFSNFFSPPKNRSGYAIMWKNIVQRGRPQMTIWRMRIACWITKARHTCRICTTYCFWTATTVTRMRLSVTYIRTLPVLLCNQKVHDSVDNNPQLEPILNQMSQYKHSSRIFKIHSDVILTPLCLPSNISTEIRHFFFHSSHIPLPILFHPSPPFYPCNDSSSSSSIPVIP